jgi:hypothetical protein
LEKVTESKVLSMDRRGEEGIGEERRGRITAFERERDEDEVERKGRRVTAMQTHKNTEKHTHIRTRTHPHIEQHYTVLTNLSVMGRKTDAAWSSNKGRGRRRTRVARASKEDCLPSSYTYEQLLIICFMCVVTLLAPRG